jgi:hypothetical protein
MAKGTYQTYTTETSIEDYRTDFIHRGAMCGALAKRYAALAAIGTEADAIVGQIDAHRAQLQQAGDDQIRATALEDAEKYDATESDTELRRTLFAKSYDIATLLPDSPSTLRRLGTKNFRARMDQAIANLKTLPDSDPVKAALLPALETEAGEFRTADEAEDATRTTLSGAKVAMTLYKTELSQAREAQLGAVLKAIGDSEKMAMFTLPWRNTSKTKAEEPAPAPPAPAGAPDAAKGTP